MLCTKAADGIRQAGAFGEPEEWRFDWERSYTRDEWLDQLLTQGGHSQFPPAKLKEVLAGIGAAIDTVGGSFTMNYTTVAVTAARGSSAAGRDARWDGVEARGSRQGEPGIEP